MMNSWTMADWAARIMGKDPYWMAAFRDGEIYTALSAWRD